MDIYYQYFVLLSEYDSLLSEIIFIKKCREMFRYFNIFFNNDYVIWIHFVIQHHDIVLYILDSYFKMCYLVMQFWINYGWRVRNDFSRWLINVCLSFVTKERVQFYCLTTAMSYQERVCMPCVFRSMCSNNSKVGEWSATLRLYSITLAMHDRLPCYRVANLTWT